MPTIDHTAAGKIISLIMSLIIIVSLSGCGSRSIYANYRAIEELQLVQTLGLDSDNGRVTVTVAVGKAGDSGSPAVLSRSGKSIPEALESLQDYTERGQLFFAHIQNILLGQEMAETALDEMLDFVERDINTRMAAELFVLRENRAEDLLAAMGDGEKISDLLASVKRDTVLRGDSHVYHILDTAVALREYGAAPVCALRMTPTKSNIFSDAPDYTAVPDGYGILQSGTPLTFLNGEDAEALSLLAGNLGTVSRSFPDGSNGAVTLELSGGAEFTPMRDDHGDYSLMEISVKAEAAIAAVDDPDAPVTDENWLESLSDRVSDELEESILRVLALSKTQDADFLALARSMKLKTGASTLSKDWLQQLEFRLNMDTVIAHSYDLSEPLGMEGRA